MRSGIVTFERYIGMRKKEYNMIDTNIKQLVEYGIANELIEEEDRIYTTNTILEMLNKDSYEEPGEVPAIDTPEKLEECLKEILD